MDVRAGPFEFGNQVLTSTHSHRLLAPKRMSAHLAHKERHAVSMSRPLCPDSRHRVFVRYTS